MSSSTENTNEQVSASDAAEEVKNGSPTKQPAAEAEVTTNEDKEESRDSTRQSASGDDEEENGHDEEDEEEDEAANNREEQPAEAVEKNGNGKHCETAENGTTAEVNGSAKSRKRVSGVTDEDNGADEPEEATQKKKRTEESQEDGAEATAVSAE